MPSIFSSGPSTSPTGAFSFDGREPDQPSDAAARPIRSDEREVDFGHDPSIDLRSGFDRDMPSSVSSDPSPRPTAPFDFGGDERDEPSDAAARTVRGGEAAVDAGHYPLTGLPGG